MMTRKPARVILLKDARQKLNPAPAPRWNPFAALYRRRHILIGASLATLAVIHFDKLPYSYLVVPIGNKLIERYHSKIYLCQSGRSYNISIL